MLLEDAGEMRPKLRVEEICGEASLVLRGLGADSLDVEDVHERLVVIDVSEGRNERIVGVPRPPVSWEMVGTTRIAGHNR